MTRQKISVENDKVKMTPEHVLEGLNQSEETLDTLESGGKKSFAWAWENIGRDLMRPIEYLEYSPEAGQVYEKLKKIAQEEQAIMEHWNELNGRIYESNMNANVITDNELKQAISGYKKLFAKFREVLESEEGHTNFAKDIKTKRSNITKTLASNQ